MRKILLTKLISLLLFTNLYCIITQQQKAIFFRLVETGDISGIENMINSMNNEDKYQIVNAKKIFGLSPLHTAARSGQLEIAKVLFNNGANIDAKDDNGKTPLHHSAQYTTIDFARWLISRGANIQEKDLHQYTPLYYVVSLPNVIDSCISTKEQEDMIKLLIINGAIVDTYKENKELKFYYDENNQKRVYDITPVSVKFCDTKEYKATINQIKQWTTENPFTAEDYNLFFIEKP